MMEPDGETVSVADGHITLVELDVLNISYHKCSLRIVRTIGAMKRKGIHIYKSDGVQAM